MEGAAVGRRCADGPACGRAGKLGITRDITRPLCSNTRHDVEVTADRDQAYESGNLLAPWSSWAPFVDVATRAPLTPGVYQMRVPDCTIVYVGMAGERRGQGIRGRLSIYRRGKGAVSGFGEAALDRALADPAFIEDHLEAVRHGRPVRTAQWAKDAISWLDVEVRWAESATQADALTLEHAVVGLLATHSIWNRVAAPLAVPVDGAGPKTSQQYERTVSPIADSAGGSLNPLDGGLTVDELSRNLGLNDGGRTVRRLLRAGFPDHLKGTSWDPLSAAQVAHVRHARADWPRTPGRIAGTRSATH